MKKKLIVSSILIVVGAVYSIYDKLVALFNLDEFIGVVLDILSSTGLEVPLDTVRAIILSVLTVGLVFSILLLLTGILINFFTKKHKVLGALSILFAILSLNFISLILGVIGGVLAIIYKPPKGLETLETQVKKLPEEPIV